MRQAVAPKQGHKGVCPRRESFVEREQGRLARQHVAEQHSNKIDELVLSNAGAGESYLFLDLYQDSRVGENRAKAATSPIQDGVAAREWGAIWMVTGACLMLRVLPPLLENDQWGDHSKAENLCFAGLPSNWNGLFLRERPRISEEGR